MDCYEVKKLLYYSLPLLNQLNALKNAQKKLAEPGMLHAEIHANLVELGEKLKKEHYSESTIKEVKFALSAYADEVLMSIICKENQTWSSFSLQETMFGEYNAGEKFYEHLSEIKKNSKEQRPLIIYYFCLLFGYKGIRYQKKNILENAQQWNDLKKIIQEHSFGNMGLVVENAVKKNYGFKFKYVCSILIMFFLLLASLITQKISIETLERAMKG